MLLRLAAGFGLIAFLSSTALAGTIEGPLQIIVSRDQQTLKVYDGDTVVASSNVSSGKEGHATPTGIFSILEKKRMHHSNLYDDAPMPFMQRLTWSGIALHASNHVPAYPASHGCVRMPDAFAKTLYRLTQRGGHVLITGGDAAPRRFDHPGLFRPEAAPADERELLSDASLRPTIPNASEGAVEVAMHMPKQPSPQPLLQRPAGDPIRILITRASPRDAMKDLQAALNTLGFDAGIADGVAGQKTSEAIRAFQTAEGLPVDGKGSTALMDTVLKKAGRDAPSNGRISVRKEFQTILEAPVTIKDPAAELGTQFLLARTAEGGDDIEWFAVTLDNRLPAATRKRLGIAEEGSIAQPSSDPVASVLDRIEVPDDIREKIGAMIGDGASVTIADTGYESETGKGTDFITLTRPGPPGAYSTSSVLRKKESSIVRIE